MWKEKETYKDFVVKKVMPLGELKAAIGLLASDSGQRMKIILEHS